MVESGVSILTSKKHFKTPIRNLIKELSSANNIAPEFEVQINNLIERRHLLIHRWYQENGIPSEEETTAIFELIELARGVEKDSKRISGLLAGYIVRWGKMNPEQDMMLDTERTRLLGLFQRAHLGDTGE
jgi:hypothetical protein